MTNAAPVALDLKIEGWQGLDWFLQDQLRDRWLAVVTTLMNMLTYILTYCMVQIPS